MAAQRLTEITPESHSPLKMGFEAMYFARIDYEDRALRINESSLEMVWRASPSYGARADAFTGVFYHHYGPPDGLCFDMSCNDATPIQVMCLLRVGSAVNSMPSLVRSDNNRTIHGWRIKMCSTWLICLLTVP